MSARYGGTRFKRGLMHFAMGKVVSAASGFLAMVLVVRLLSIGEFADYSVLVSLVEILTAVSALGLSHALLRYVPALYSQHFHVALRDFVGLALGLRTMVLFLAAMLIFAFSPQLTPLIGLADYQSAFELFIVVVIFRTTSHFLSQVLESTLHQGIAQLGFAITSVTRLLGMLYLLHGGHAVLLDVIWVEVVTDGLGMLVMLGGLFHVVWRTAQEQQPPAEDKVWLKRYWRQIVSFSLAGYAQHMVGLPFGSNTNRLIGGHLFSNPVMASFGFATSLYEYIKRYLPAQLLIGLIRPVIVARFTDGRNFERAAQTCEHVVLINLVLISLMFSGLLIGGHHLLDWISAGKYSADATLILAALLLVLALETHRLILELLVQTVERYDLLIPTNLMLSISVLPAFLLFPWLGAVGFPLINALFLAISNFWVRRQLAAQGYELAADWKMHLKLSLMLLASSLLGKLMMLAGMPWLVAMILSMTLFSTMTWIAYGVQLKAFVHDLTGHD